MRSRMLIVFLTLLFSAGLALPATTRAGLDFQSSGKSAVAYFSQDDGCVFTAAYLAASDNKSKDQGNPSDPSSIASVSVYSYDYCAGSLLFSVWGQSDVAASAFKISANLTQASLSPTTITGYDQTSGVPVNISVAMNWVGTGGISMSNGTFHYRDDFIVINGDGASRYRIGSAVGSIVVDGTDYAAALSSTFAELDMGNFLVVSNPK